MHVAVIGAGNIGGTLGSRWAESGHTITFGVREPDAAKYDKLRTKAGSNIRFAEVAEALQDAEVVLVAIPGQTVEGLVTTHKDALDGKIIIDAANNMQAPQMNGRAHFSAHTPAASYFRAFNALGWENFAQPQLDGVQVDLIYAGTDGPVRAQVSRLIADLGLRPVYIGGLDQVEIVDNLTRLWFALAYGQNFGRRVALKVLA